MVIVAAAPTKPSCCIALEVTEPGAGGARGAPARLWESRVAGASLAWPGGQTAFHAPEGMIRVNLHTIDFGHLVPLHAAAIASPGAPHSRGHRWGSQLFPVSRGGAAGGCAGTRPGEALAHPRLTGELGGHPHPAPQTRSLRLPPRSAPLPWVPAPCCCSSAEQTCWSVGLDPSAPCLFLS